jgi:MSHA pilin protein MshC
MPAASRRLPRIGMHTQGGFTLAELVVVLMLTGVLAAFAIPRLFNQNEFAGRGARDFVASGLRYAQKSAIAMRRNVCVAVGSTGLAITYASAAGSTQACAAGNQLSNPANGLPYSDTANALQGGATVSTPTSVSFDALGRTSAAASITLSNHATPITVEAETGLVH